MANNAQPSTAGKATNGMTAGQLAGLSAAGLGNVAISGTQTVDQALGSLGVAAATPADMAGIAASMATGNIMGVAAAFAGLVGSPTASGAFGAIGAALSGNAFGVAANLASAFGEKGIASAIGLAGNVASGNIAGIASAGLSMTGNTQAAAAVSGIASAMHGNAFGALAGAMAAFGDKSGSSSQSSSAGQSSSTSLGGGFSGAFSGGSSNANAGTTNDSDHGNGMEGDFIFTQPTATSTAEQNGDVPTYLSSPVLNDSSRTYIQQIADSLARNAQQGYLNSPKNETMQPTFEPIFSKKDDVYSYNFQDTFGTDHTISLNEVKGFTKLKTILDAHSYTDPVSGTQEVDQRAIRAAWNHPDVQTQVYNQISTNVIDTLSNSAYFLGNVYQNLKSIEASTLFGMPNNYQDLPSLNLTQEAKKLVSLGSAEYTQQAQAKDVTNAIFSEGILHNQLPDSNVRKIGLDDLVAANNGAISYNPKVGLYTKKVA